MAKDDLLQAVANLRDAVGSGLISQPSALSLINEVEKNTAQKLPDPTGVKSDLGEAKLGNGRIEKAQANLEAETVKTLTPDTTYLDESFERIVKSRENKTAVTGTGRGVN